MATSANVCPLYFSNILRLYKRVTEFFIFSTLCVCENDSSGIGKCFHLRSCDCSDSQAAENMPECLGRKDVCEMKFSQCKS